VRNPRNDQRLFSQREDSRAGLAGEILVALGWDKITRVCEDKGEKGGEREKENLTFKIAGIRLSFRIWQSRWRGRTSGRESLRRGEKIRKVGYRL